MNRTLSTRRMSRIAAGVAMAASLALLAGCAGEAAPATSTDAAGNTTIAYPANVATIKSYPGIPVGIQEGYFADEFGSDPKAMTIQTIASAAEGVQALAAGHVDIAVTGFDPAPLIGIPNIRAVAVTESSPATQAALVSPTSSIKTIADLKGKTVGSYTPSATAFISIVLAKGGLTLNDIKYVQLGNDTGAAALTSGAIDAWFTFDPFYAQAELQGLATALVTGDDVGYKNSVMVYTTDAYLASNPQSVQAFLKAYKSSTDWINANKADAATVIATATGLDPAVATKTIERRNYVMVPVPGDNLDWMKSFSQTSIDVGVTKSLPDFDTLVDTSAYDAAFGTTTAKG